MFKISRMTRRSDGELVADFDVEVSGITLTGCGLRRKENGDLVTYAPRGFSRPGTRTVWLSNDARDALDDAGYRVAVELGLAEPASEDADAGLKRVLSAEVEACERAGL